ncbi:transposase [Actinosynnema pretiosum subsp. pretiosum]|uniref:Transposase n=1 Tax=Actinosynnema pretiosum subsp. pretiosum TaxID=103721 RepID=A0AA45R679_9PSEU|nr:transposase [Actinosynnema pretiosum subsp. pretiosum]
MPHPRGRFHRGCPCCRPAAFHQPARRAVGYPADVADAQWAELDPLLPDPACLAGRGGRWEKHCRCLIVDAILYVVDNGITWRALPVDFPPWPTVYKRFAPWEKVGAAQRLLDGLRDRVRLGGGAGGGAVGGHGLAACCAGCTTPPEDESGRCGPTAAIPDP